MLRGFDRIRIINLAYRRDRRAEMEHELATVGLGHDPRVAFFEAVRPADAGDFYSIGARGVYLSHLAILRDAAQARANVLILEDDCHFTPDARNRLAQVAADGSWDLFYGGYDAADPADLMNSDIVGAHMMGFTHQAAARLCAYLDDLAYEGAHPPIDGAYVWFRRAHRDVRTRFAAPPLAIQRASRSDIADLKFFDRVAAIRPLVNRVRRFKSWCLQQ